MGSWSHSYGAAGPPDGQQTPPRMTDGDRGASGARLLTKSRQVASVNVLVFPSVEAGYSLASSSLSLAVGCFDPFSTGE